ncbi:CDG_1a_G0025700.mRNA.1.CDS.1 [Saccharomyces cerevisiae]|nr:CDG_1a_G0025700.mRNA.1.CDS.1 [Saccharomyces cerevisiae]CAI7344824.1 CDG_1a_G0025700.mRNA.1.CDS.1 [Saccharomyces cerevisiae]
MNVLQFLGFRSDEIKHLFLYGIDIYFCPEGVFTQLRIMQGLSKDVRALCLLGCQKVSYRRIAWEALAVERMLRNDEEYKEYLEDIEPYHGDPVGYLKYFSVKRERDLLSDTEKLCLCIDSTRGANKGAKFSACLEGRSKSCILKYGATCVNRRQRCCSTFELGREKCQEEWRQKTIRSFVEALEKVGVFQRLRSMTSAGLQGPQYVKLQFSRHHRQLRSRYELSLGMHLRDQIALGVTPSKVPHWTAFLSMLIGLFYNKTFRQKLEYL